MKKIMVIAICLCMVVLHCSCSQEPQGIGETGISHEEFNQLSFDMSYYTACEIIGGEGELIAKEEYDEDDRTKYVSTYRFDGEAGGYAELEFTVYGYKDILKIDFGDYLTGKRQFDLK